LIETKKRLVARRFILKHSQTDTLFKSGIIIEFDTEIFSQNSCNQGFLAIFSGNSRYQSEGVSRNPKS
jgi:hypothetical protein